MYNRLMQECEIILADWGIPIPDVEIELTDELYSYTEGEGVIYLGVMLRAGYAVGVCGESRMVRSILHEMLHDLMEAYPPSKKVKKLFGSPGKWKAPQNMWRLLACSDGYVTHYAHTHPEEDLVETAVSVLTGIKYRDDVKSRGAETWLDTMN